LRSNRTIVGLKLGYAFAKMYAILKQQSHHCGIETRGIRRMTYTLTPQQSHHCGIETLNRHGHHRPVCSNRTIVGLKPVLSSIARLATSAQQSHHCGIETETTSRDMGIGSGSNRTIVGLKLRR